MTSFQTSRSWSVYPMIFGFPVVPEEAWIRLTSATFTANRP
jgi:hypothetical protein